MPLAPADMSPEDKLFMMVEKVVIVKGRIPSDPTIWEFYIDDKILRVDTDKLLTTKTFSQQYIKEFDRPAPKIEGKRWNIFLDALAEDKSEIVEAPEESADVFIARQIFEIICDRDVSDDPNEALAGTALYQHILAEDKKMYFCMPSIRLLELVSDAGFKIAPATLSGVMAQLGMKRNGTPRVRYGGPQLRSWCFIPDAVLQQKGA